MTNGKKKAGPTAGSFMAELQQETDRVRQATAALADGLWLELLKVAEALPASVSLSLPSMHPLCLLYL